MLNLNLNLNLQIGKPDTSPDKPAHTQGVRQGNRPGTFDDEPGHINLGQTGAAALDALLARQGQEQGQAQELVSS